MVGSISVIVGDTRRPLQYMTYAKNLHLLLLGALRCAILLCIMKSEKKLDLHFARPNDDWDMSNCREEIVLPVGPFTPTLILAFW